MDGFCKVKSEVRNGIDRDIFAVGESASGLVGDSGGNSVISFVRKADGAALIVKGIFSDYGSIVFANAPRHRKCPGVRQFDRSSSRAVGMGFLCQLYGHGDNGIDRNRSRIGKTAACIVRNHGGQFIAAHFLEADFTAVIIKRTFEETTLQLNLQEILRLAEVEDFFVGNNTKAWKLRFEPDVTILDGIKRVISLLDGWKVDETSNGVIGVAAATDARFDQPAVYIFERDKTCWSYSVEYDDSEAVSKVCVTCANPENTVYATVPRSKWWVQPSHRTTYVTAADGATLAEITAMAEELAQAIAISGRQESFVGIFTPQLTIGDEVRIISGAKTETLGTVTDVTHNFGKGGFYTAFTVDSGGRKGKARLSDLIGQASEKPNLNGVTIY